MENLPKVSIITPTYNKKSFFPLAINNFLSFDYPEDKLEWIILDDGEENVKDTLPKDNRIKYYYYDKEAKDKLYHLFIENVNNKRAEYNKYSKRQKRINKVKKYKLLPEHKQGFKGNRIPLGMKRNICIQYATSDYIIHMDDDDLYPPKSIITRVKEMLENNVKCVGCSAIGCFHINKLISVIYTPNENYSDAKKIVTSTLAYTKDFWKEQKFENQDIKNEGEHFLKKRKCKVTHWKYIIVSLFHSKNDHNMKSFEGEANGWHYYPLSNELFTLITSLDEHFLERTEVQMTSSNKSMVKNKEHNHKEHDHKDEN